MEYVYLKLTTPSSVFTEPFITYYRIGNKKIISLSKKGIKSLRSLSVLPAENVEITSKDEFDKMYNEQIEKFN